MDGVQPRECASRGPTATGKRGAGQRDRSAYEALRHLGAPDVQGGSAGGLSVWLLGSSTLLLALWVVTHRWRRREERHRARKFAQEVGILLPPTVRRSIGGYR